MISKHPTPRRAAQTNTSPTILLFQAITGVPLRTLLPRLEASLRASELWVERVREISTHSADLRIEAHRSAIPTLNILLAVCGIHLDHSSSTSLSTLCSPLYPIQTSPVELKLTIRHTGNPEATPRTDC